MFFFVLTLALVQSVAPASGPLDRARALMTEGDLDGAAAAAAQALAAQPGSGAAQLVLGMVHFRAERFADALEAFRSARSSQTPPAPGPLAFNEGSALFALARFDEAEKAFEEAAARDPKLGPLCGLNAGQSALAAGALDRARNHLLAAERLPDAAALAVELTELRREIDRREADRRRVRAETLRMRGEAALRAGRLDEARAAYREMRDDARARGAPATEVAELAYAEGLLSRRAGRPDEAAALFGEAASLEPREAEYHYMLGVSALERDQPDTARAALERSLQLGLERTDAEIARDSLDSLSLGLRRMGSGLQLALEMGTGYDSNVGQLSVGRVEQLTGESAETAGGYWGSLSLELAGARSFGPRWFGEVSYWLEQRAFGDEALELYNLQSHVLGARGELTPGGPLRLGLTLEGDYQFAGLREFGFLLRSFALAPHLALDETAHTATVLRLRWQEQDAAPAEDHLDGRRVELKLGQIWRSQRLRGELAMRHRREIVGTRTVELGSLGRRERFQGRYVAPYAYNANALLADAAVTLGSALRIGIDGSLERLRYREDSVVLAVGPLGGITEARRLRREDRRIGLGARLELALSDLLDITLRYDLVDNGSNVDFAFDSKDYLKQMVSLSLGVGF